MRRAFLIIFVLSLLVPQTSFAATKKSVVKDYSDKELLNRFLIQTESYSRLWYAESKTKQRYYIQNDSDLNWLIDRFGIKVTQAELNKIAANKKQKSQSKILQKYKGKIVYTTKENVWYVNPGNNLRYQIKDYLSFIKVVPGLALKVDNKNLRKIAMNKEQLTFDAAFASIAYVQYDGINFSNGFNEEEILPIASLTKLMTALVLLDQNPVWDQYVKVTKEEIDYPKTIVGDDTTSEIDLQAGDLIRVADLWIAMLTASSNQAAVILADNSGLDRKTFVSFMNDKAKNFGLKKTILKDVSGLDPNNISTAKEMAMIGYQAFLKSKIIEGTNFINYTFAVTDKDGKLRNVNVKNRNYSLLAYQPQASKTGFLVEAQRNAVVKKNDQIVVILHALSMSQRNQILSKLLGEPIKLSRR